MSDALGRTHGVITRAFWNKRFGSGGDRAFRVLVYLCAGTFSSMAGIGQLAMPLAARELEMSERQLRATLEKLAELGHIRWDGGANVFMVPDLGEIEMGQLLKSADKRVTGFQKAVARYHWHPFADEVWSRYEACYSLGNRPWLASSGSRKQGASVEAPSGAPSGAPSQGPSDAPWGGASGGASEARDQGSGVSGQRPGREGTPAPVPEDFWVSDELRARIVDAGCSEPTRQNVAAFIANAKSKGKLACDWDAAFMEWMLRELKFSAGRSEPRHLQPAVDASKRLWAPDEVIEVTGDDDV